MPSELTQLSTGFWIYLTDFYYVRFSTFLKNAVVPSRMNSANFQSQKNFVFVSLE